MQSLLVALPFWNQQVGMNLPMWSGTKIPSIRVITSIAKRQEVSISCLMRRWCVIMVRMEGRMSWDCHPELAS